MRYFHSVSNSCTLSLKWCKTTHSSYGLPSLNGIIGHIYFTPCSACQNFQITWTKKTVSQTIKLVFIPVIILSSKRDQIFIVWRECQSLNFHFMQGQQTVLRARLIIPDDNIGFESHVRHLTRGYVSAAL